MRLVCSVCLALSLALPTVASALSLSSPEIADGGILPDRQVFNGFGCAGGNISPELVWKDPPDGTKSFVVTVYDPDAPTGSGWWHWVVFNIPATATGLPAGAGGPVGAGGPQGTGLPAGAVQARTDFGRPGFGGACPPAGDPPHRYVFTVYALDVERLDLPPDSSGAMVGCGLHEHRLGQATLTARYGR